MTDEQHAYRAQTCRHRVTTRVSGTRDLWRCSWCNTLLQDNVTPVSGEGPALEEAEVVVTEEVVTEMVVEFDIDVDFTNPDDVLGVVLAAIEDLEQDDATRVLVEALGARWDLQAAIDELGQPEHETDHEHEWAGDPLQGNSPQCRICGVSR